MTEPIDINRRKLMLGVVGAGFAIASAPVLSQQIKTPPQGLRVGSISIPTPDGAIPGYWAMPDRPGQFPILLVIQEIFGVHEHIQDMCRRFARQGYLAIAPELFVRQGNVQGIADIPTILQNVVSHVPDAQVNADLDAAVAYAAKSGRGDVKRLGAVGYCWGGRAVWEYANYSKQLKAGVAYYGRLEAMKSDIRPQDPIDFGATLKVPVLGLYAENDQSIPLTSVEKMQAELRQSKSGSEIVIFPGVGHAFNADYRASYNKEAAERAYQMTLAWFKSHGVV